MYSLYRAWFGPEESYPRLETLSPPDTVVRVGNDGEYHFVAHRNVLAAHSGYLKALLAGDGNDGPIVTSVTVPSTIGGEAFAPLLNYMYTGRLEVSLENIYTVLLATHLLHMPGALEQCRAALLRLRAAPTVLPTESSTSQTNVLRPVPNRLLGPTFGWATTTHLCPPRHLDLPHLPALQLPPAVPTILPTPPTLPKSQTSSFGPKERSPSPHSPNSQPARPTSESVPASPELIVASSSSSSTQRAVSPSSEHVSVSDASDQTHHRRSKSNPRPKSQEKSNQTPGVVYDIACCDGPVKFHRVLNENYSAEKSLANAPRPSPCNGRSCRDDTSENDENEHRSPSSSSTYTCSFCRHTFKSQYCYRKHARRHLLPTDAEQQQQQQQQQQQRQSETPPQQPVEPKKREVRLLDLNVQYYPCKICGSKFPSYYFVHKHRKLCHANVEESSSGNDEQKPSTSEHSEQQPI